MECRKHGELRLDIWLWVELNSPDCFTDGSIPTYMIWENLRFELFENGRRTSFVYHNGELLHEEGGNEKQSSYHLGAGIDALQRGKELSYYHRDEQLSTAFITGGQGEIQSSYQYDAFGTEIETNEQFPNRIRYTGQQYDEFTEQYYLRARYYNPVLGRFMQEDAYQGDGLNQGVRKSELFRHKAYLDKSKIIQTLSNINMNHYL